MRSGVQGFQSQRLQQLRLSAAMTQAELADLIQCAKTNITKWENGKSSPESGSFKRICEIFNVAESWLLEVPVASVKEQPSFFRAQNQTPKVSREIAKIRLDWAEEISYKLQECLEFPELDVPQYNGDFRTLSDFDIEELAEDCRKRWMLGDAPISDLIISMESNGIVVTRGSLGFTKMDGVSRWFHLEDRPYVFLCMDKANGFRTRFDAAHELGHIVLHKGLAEVDYQRHYHLLEKQAHRFASALLLPSTSFTRDVRFPVLETFLALKPKWKTSVAAMIRRCQDLEIIGDDSALRLWKARSARGWVQREPLDDTLTPEEPKLLQRSIRMLVENNILDKRTLRHILGMPTVVVEELCNLPQGYFDQDTDGKVVELRLRINAQQDRGRKTSTKSGQVVSLKETPSNV